MRCQNNVQFGLLGAISAVVNGAERTPRAAKVRSVLALMVAQPGSVVTFGDIAEELWGENPPNTAASAVYVYISQLRKLLGPLPGSSAERHPMIESLRPGYRLNVPAECTDLAQFRSLAEAGRQALERQEPAEAARLMREALAVWRGPAMQGIESSGELMRLALGLNEQRASLCEELFDLELALGRHTAVLPKLVEMSRMHPLREHLASQLMLALYRSGQRAEALCTYRKVHATLREELGVDPCQELLEMHHSILAGTVPLP